MASQLTGTNTDEGASGEFGANEWLVDELYEQYLADKDSVDKSWWPVLESYRSHQQAKSGAAAPAAPAAEAPAAATPADHGTAPAETTAAVPQTESAQVAEASGARPATQPVAKTTSIEAKPQPIPAEAPSTRTSTADQAAKDAAADAEKDVVSPLRGMAKSLATNMDASLTVPTATSVRSIPAKLLIDNRIVINNHLRRARGGKVSFTHLIGWALVQALK